MKKLKVHTDGGARGNPGPGAIGIVIKNENNKTIFKIGKKIGWATNNQAEYRALIFALKTIRASFSQAEEIDFFLDSKLVASQMKGEFKIKSIKIKPLFQEAKEIEAEIKAKINYHFLSREKNKEADFLLNQALDYLC